MYVDCVRRISWGYAHNFLCLSYFRDSPWEAPHNLAATVPVEAPAPDGPVLRVVHQAVVAHADPVEDARRRAVPGERVRDDGADLGIGEGEGGESARGLGGEAAATELGSDLVPDLDDPIVVGPSL